MELEDLDLLPEGYIRTFTGKTFNPFEITTDDIDIRDIAHALSLICRFGGHCKKFHSVAQHCLQVSSLLPDDLKFEGLMHDASEAYLLDMPSPIKAKLSQYKDVEEFIMLVVAKKFNISWPVSPEVKSADREGLAYEWYNNVVTDECLMDTLSSTEAESLFLKKFEELSMKDLGKFNGQKEIDLDLDTLEYIKFTFGLHSDHSTQCNGYRSLISKIEEEKKKLGKVKKIKPGEMFSVDDKSYIIVNPTLATDEINEHGQKIILIHKTFLM